MAEGGGLLNRYTGHTVSGVRIPPSPPKDPNLAILFNPDVWPAYELAQRATGLLPRTMAEGAP